MAARLTDEQKQLRSVLEADLQKAVINMATAAGWRWFHPPKAGVRKNGSVRTTVPGFPDLTLVRGERLVFIELKRETGVVSPAQADWHAALHQAGAEVYVVRPSDLPTIRRILSKGNR